MLGSWKVEKRETSKRERVMYSSRLPGRRWSPQKPHPKCKLDGPGEGKNCTTHTTGQAPVALKSLGFRWFGETVTPLQVLEHHGWTPSWDGTCVLRLNYHHSLVVKSSHTRSSCRGQLWRWGGCGALKNLRQPEDIPDSEDWCIAPWPQWLGAETMIWAYTASDS